MGNKNNPKKKGNKGKKESNKTSETNNINDDNLNKQIDEDEICEVKLNLLKKGGHTINCPIEDVITFPNLEETIIIGCRSGRIVEMNHIISSTDNIDSLDLYNCNKRLYTLILLKQNNNKICVGLETGIIIFKLNPQNRHILEKEKELNTESEDPIYSLLELNNGNLISGGKNITLWKKESYTEYTKINSIPVDSTNNSKIINLVEFPFFNTIFATQENTHIIFLIKNDETSISLIKKIENVSSISNKGSAKMLSKNAMLLSGKFALNAIDSSNGDVVSKYPGIDRGSLIKLSGNEDTEGFWVVSNFMGRHFEFYEQEGNDLIFVGKNKEKEIGWGNGLVRINDECFVAFNHYGTIFVFKVDYSNK